MSSVKKMEHINYTACWLFVNKKNFFTSQVQRLGQVGADWRLSVACLITPPQWQKSSVGA
ncbi:MAG: hypothetical protein KIS63_13895 [Caldilineales bacterium]|nr:hypothetical protein [Caldilineales bacterium]